MFCLSDIIQKDFLQQAHPSVTIALHPQDIGRPTNCSRSKMMIYDKKKIAMHEMMKLYYCLH